MNTRFFIPYKSANASCIYLWLCASLTSVLVFRIANASAQTTEIKKTRVLVLPFSGQDGPRARSALMWRLQREPSIELISDLATITTVRRLGIRKWDPDAYRRVAEVLRVQVYIRGKVERAGFPWITRFDIASPDDGSTVASERWTTPKLGTYTVVEPRVYQNIRTHITLLAPISLPARQAPPQLSEPETPKESAPKLEPSVDESVPQKARGLTYRAFNISLMTGIIRRAIEADTYTYNHNRYDTADDRTFIERRAFKSAGLGAMEIGLGAEFYPGIFWDIDWMVPFGVVASYRHSLLTGARACRARGFDQYEKPIYRSSPNDTCSSLGQIDVPITQYEAYMGIRGRWSLGDLNQPLEVITDVGFDRFASQFDLSQLKKVEFPAVIPPLVYQSIKLGLEIRYPIVARYLVLGGSFAYNLGITSPDQNFIWGGVRVQQGPSSQPLTGGAQGYVFGGSIRSEAPYLFDGAYWTLNFEWVRFSTLFRGQSRAAGSSVISCKTGKEDPSATDANNCSRWEVWPVAGEGEDKQVDPTNLNVQQRGGISEPVNDDYIRINLGLGWMFN